MNHSLNQEIQLLKTNKETPELRNKVDYKLNLLFLSSLKHLEVTLNKNPSLLPHIKQEMMVAYFKALPLSQKVWWYVNFNALGEL